ncbi:MAG: ABC transporter ATP-binding protein [Candidatus Korarchaeum sp.]|nr:ABC transporter ATP-binding protein [Candidatus Korarchaeum sp.]
MEILRVEGLRKYFPIGGGFLRGPKYIRAVDGVTLSVRRGETLGLVGESGSGKSTLVLTAMKLHEPTSGRIFLDGVDVTEMREKEFKKFRKKLGIVFQDPHSSLNPRSRIGEIIARPMKIHGYEEGEIRRKLREVIEEVGLSSEHLERYPHQLSGGQQQRVAIARAIVTKPDLVFLDEPTSSLDISVQSQILNLLLDLQQHYEMAYVFVTHDLLTVKHLSDRIAVMYAGKVVEIAGAEKVFIEPKHPYTATLILSLPAPDPSVRSQKEFLAGRGVRISGEPPNLLMLPEGCRFHPRCPFTIDPCRREEPELRRIDDHMVACHRAEEVL